jgi:hypothetical protein
MITDFAGCARRLKQDWNRMLKSAHDADVAESGWQAKSEMDRW